MLLTRQLPRLAPSIQPLRFLSTSTSAKPLIKLIEVGPRDGLQNEKKTIDADTKIELIRRLVGVGMRDVEVGSFVSPKWIPQMGTTSAVLSSPVLRELSAQYPTLNYPVLVPNLRGMENLIQLMNTTSSTSSEATTTTAKLNPLTKEIAIFISATPSFSHANLNMSIPQSLAALTPVITLAKSLNLRIRGYISVVIGCPFEGKVEPEKVAQLAEELVGMGCYEISLGDTIGVGTPDSWAKLVEAVGRKVGVEKLAAHCHDTYGTSLSNILQCISMGIATYDTSISGLGGCPYSPGATGNVATEDVIYLLESSGYSTGLLPLPSSSSSSEWDDLLVEGTPRNLAFEKICGVGSWIGGVVRGEEVGTGSRVGRAVEGRIKRRIEEERKKEAKAKL